MMWSIYDASGKRIASRFETEAAARSVIPREDQHRYSYRTEPIPGGAALTFLRLDKRTGRRFYLHQWSTGWQQLTFHDDDAAQRWAADEGIAFKGETVGQ